MRASALSTSSRLEVRPAARSRASWATVHMGDDCMRHRLASALFGGSCFLCRGSARGELCGRCLSQAPAYDATQAALAYEFPADALVQALKFRGELALAPLLAALLAKKLRGERVDLVVPVPLSHERLRRRGYNQAVEIARHLPGGRPALTLCQRTREAPPQMELPYD